RIETDQNLLVSTAWWKRLVVCEHTSTSRGSSDTEVKALAVMAWSTLPITVVTMVMPLAKRPKAALNARSSTGRSSLTGAPNTLQVCQHQSSDRAQHK